MTTPVLEVRNLKRDYVTSQGLLRPAKVLHAVKGVNFTLEKGRTLAVVGESGCGKSTLARMITLIDPPTSGEILIDGIPASADHVTKELRQKVQIVFQNPYGSLNPRQKIGDVLAEPLLLNTDMSAAERREKSMAMLIKVGLQPEHYNRYPHMFSGGQRQRIAIARALVIEPDFLVLDEPTSALDISIQAQVIDLLRAVQQKRNLTYLFISHDLRVVKALAHSIVVMRHGKVVETGPAAAIFARPRDPYTRQLMAAAFDIEPVCAPPPADKTQNNTPTP